MPNYRRVYLKGSTVFITLVTYQRAPLFLDPGPREILHNTWRDVSKRHPFTTDAICLLPDHLHALITLPEDDHDYSLRVREIKRRFTRHFNARYGRKASGSPSRESKQEAKLWQRRFWEHTIRDERDYENHFHYIHFNPVKHGFVEQASSWAWSSFHRYVQMGVYDADWESGYEQADQGFDFGE